MPCGADKKAQCKGLQFTTAITRGGASENVQTCAVFWGFNIRPLTSFIHCYWAIGAGGTEEALAAFPVHPPPPGQELLSRRSIQTPVETHSRTTSAALQAKRPLWRGQCLCNAPASVSGGCVCRRRRTESGQSEGSCTKRSESNRTRLLDQEEPVEQRWRNNPWGDHGRNPGREWVLITLMLMVLLLFYIV